jgi:hypothetical protein
MRHLPLRFRILESGKKAYEIAQELRWHPSKLSTIISGVYTPSSMEKEDLAKVLGCDVDEVFPSARKEAV